MAGKGPKMVKNFEDVQKLGKDNVEATLKAFGAVSKGAQTAAAEIADYSKKAFEDGTAVAEKLIGAKSIETAIELQTDYARRAYDSFVAQSVKLGELYADVAKETYKPFESYFGKISTAR